MLICLQTVLAPCTASEQEFVYAPDCLKIVDIGSLLHNVTYDHFGD